MSDGVFWTILHARATLNASIDIGSCGFAIDNFKDIGGADILTDSCTSTFVVVNFEGEIAFFVLIRFHGHRI